MNKGQFRTRDDKTWLMNPDDNWLVITEYGKIIQKFRNKYSAIDYAKKFSKNYMGGLKAIPKKLLSSYKHL